MTTLGPDTARIESLRGGFGGSVLLPGAADYDEARRIFNAAVDKRPGVIAQCTSRDDVARALAMARETGMEVSVRGGGHGVAGKSLTEGGLVIDLRRMNEAVVDADALTIRVGGGATMADLDNAAQPHALATTGGRASTTGVGGFTLGGGSGWLERKFGLACDNLLAADLVTAEGRIVRTDADDHPELFWALHGGGGNFGVVTSFTFALHKLPDFSMALLLWSPEYGPDVLRTYRDFFAGAPDEFGGAFLFLTGPPEEFVPAHLVGRLTCAALVTCAGPEAVCQEAVTPLLGLAPEGALITDMPYAEFQRMLDDPPGMRNYWSAEYLQSFPDEAVDAFCARAPEMIVPSPSLHVVFPQGGMLAGGPQEFPVPWRNMPYAVHPFGVWEDPADDARGAQWAHDVCADVRPWATETVYLNFIGDEGHARVVDSFGPGNYGRLAAVKAEYDPDNVFHLNQNIRPA
ncbi:MAG TPA: FAD-binding oxidoreductase [Yinghuangia sp.]|nr:FAD-binding oxidoreductase [Yinghuangia sp.]